MVNDPQFAARSAPGLVPLALLVFTAAGLGIGLAAAISKIHRLEGDLNASKYELMETQWQVDHCQSAPVEP